MGAALYDRLYKLYKRSKVPTVTIFKGSILQGRVGSLFIKDYRIKREDIALISTISLGENEYAINVINHVGEIQELPIIFESEEKAKEQVVAMKEMLRME
jgi:hypothetical protein